MKFMTYALLPALALANPLLATTETDPSVGAASSRIQGTCENELHYCGSDLVNNKGKLRVFF